MKGRILFAAAMLASLVGSVTAESIVTIGKYWALETDYTYSVSYEGMGKSRSVNYTYTQQLFPGLPGQSVSGTTQAGEMIYSINGENNIVWSVDIAQPSSGSQQTYNAAVLLDAGYMLSLDKLYYQYGQFVASNKNSIQALTDGAAGFQLAIWELTYETMNLDLLSGAFAVESSIAAIMANEWLMNMDNMMAPGMQRKILVNPETEDVIHYLPEDVGPISSVPEPLTMLTLSIAGVSVGGYVLRRLKSKPENSRKV